METDSTNYNGYSDWDRVYRTFNINSLPWASHIIHPGLQDIINCLPIKSGRALDIGCGIGQTARYLAEVGFDTTAIDISGKAITLCREQTPNRLKINYIPANSINFVDEEKYDLIIDFLHFHDVQESHLKQYINNICTLARNNAYIIISALSDSDKSCPATKCRISNYVKGYVYYYSIADLNNLLSRFSRKCHSGKINVGNEVESYVANYAIFNKI